MYIGLKIFPLFISTRTILISTRQKQIYILEFLAPQFNAYPRDFSPEYYNFTISLNINPCSYWTVDKKKKKMKKLLKNLSSIGYHVQNFQENILMVNEISLYMIVYKPKTFLTKSSNTEKIDQYVGLFYL